MATQGQISVLDFANQTSQKVDGTVVTDAGTNPGAGKALRQSVVLGDPGDNTQYANVDTDGALHVAEGRVASATRSSFPDSNTTVTQILAASSTRVGISIQNLSTADLYLGYDNTITSLVYDDIVPGGTHWNAPPGWAYTGALYGLFSANNGLTARVVAFPS